MTAHGILGESRSWLVEEVVKEMRKEQVNAHPFAHCKKVLLTTLQVGVICIGTSLARGRMYCTCSRGPL